MKEYNSYTEMIEDYYPNYEDTKKETSESYDPLDIKF